MNILKTLLRLEVFWKIDVPKMLKNIERLKSERNPLKMKMLKGVLF